MGVSKEIFAPQRPGRGLRMPKLYYGRFAEFKNGIGLEFGAKMKILGGLNHRATWSRVPL